MRFFIVLVAFVFSLLGCTSNYPLKSVDYNDLFTNGNSKVWVIDKMVVNKVNVAQRALKNKEVLIFHESGVVDYLPLKAIGESSPKKGRFYLDSDKKLLSITFNDNEWLFDLPILEENRIVLRPKQKRSAPFSAELVPLPELD